MSLRPRLTGDQKANDHERMLRLRERHSASALARLRPRNCRNAHGRLGTISFASCAGMSHGLAAMALSGFLSRLTKCAESQDLRLEPLDVRKATLSTVLARASSGIALELQ